MTIDHRTLSAVALLAALSAAGAGCKCTKSGKKGPPPEPPATPITELQVRSVTADLSVPDPDAAYWRDVPRGQVALTAQPMMTPRPASTTTDHVVVAAVHDGKHIAFRLTWDDPEKSEAGHLGEFSDAAALEFPIKDLKTTPVMMGAADNPVHIFHWRAQYQRDKEQGKPEMTTLYPNMSIDMYPMEFKEAPSGSAEDKEQFSPGKAAGNPQAYAKTGVDEIVAEGLTTSAVQEGHSAEAKGVWSDGKWKLVITRPLAIEGGSTLQVGGESAIAFAVWQGGLSEVGSRKCVTMVWLPLKVL